MASGPEQKQPPAREWQQDCRSATNEGAGASSFWRSRRVPANASGRSGDHRPLADDRVPCVQLTIRPTAGALAFTKSSHAGWPCGRFCFWCEPAVSGSFESVSATAGVERKQPRRADSACGRMRVLLPFRSSSQGAAFRAWRYSSSWAIAQVRGPHTGEPRPTTASSAGACSRTRSQLAILPSLLSAQTRARSPLPC